MTFYKNPDEKCLKLDLTGWWKIRTRLESIFTVMTSLIWRHFVICTVKTINAPNNTVLIGWSETVKKILDRYELKNERWDKNLTARHPCFKKWNIFWKKWEK